MNREEYDIIMSSGKDNFWFRQRNRILRHLIDKYAEKSSVMLDAGTGTGIDLDISESVIGLDIDIYGLMHASGKGHSAVNADASALPFKDTAFDCIYAMDLICNENVNIEHTMNEFHRILKPQGTLIMNLPAVKALYSSHDRAVGNARRFNRPHLMRMKEFRKFVMTESIYWNTFLMPAAVARRIALNAAGGIHSDTGSTIRVNSVFDHIMKLEFPYAAAGSMPIGLSIMTVMRKK